MLDQREFNKILGAIKRVFSYSAHRRVALGIALSRKKGPRGGKMYTCKACRGSFKVNEIQVDHIDPVVPIGTATLSMSWDNIINRLYCDTNNLQVLCKGCHKKKTKKEAALRAKARKEK